MRERKSEKEVYAKKGNDSTTLGQPKKEYDSTTLGRREYDVLPLLMKSCSNWLKYLYYKTANPLFSFSLHLVMVCCMISYLSLPSLYTYFM